MLDCLFQPLIFSGAARCPCILVTAGAFGSRLYNKWADMASSGLVIHNRSVFRRVFEIPVRCINGNMKPQGAFVGATAIRSMRVSLETVVQYASRYVYVQSENSVVPSTRFARDWKEILRWEVDKFWFVDLSGSQPKIETLFQARKSFSSEHGRRSGEYLAYGFALAFIDRLLNIHPQRVMFFAASGTRADFHLPIVMPNGSRAGLEAHSRGYFREPHAKEITAIIGKKTSAAKVTQYYPGSGLVVYFLHGAYKAAFPSAVPQMECDRQLISGLFEERLKQLVTVSDAYNERPTLGAFTNRRS